jgi:Na+-driven multidrug efflux pump
MIKLTFRLYRALGWTRFSIIVFICANFFFGTIILVITAFFNPHLLVRSILAGLTFSLITSPIIWLLRPQINQLHNWTWKRNRD